ncbi:glutamate decarboxylase, partial [Clostridium perfringens]
DKSEYPQTTDLENRCVNILADLWHAPKDESFMGTSTVGSSEACMLGGMAMKFRWRNRAKALGMDVTSRKPNLVISSGYQVCWEKFCVYWDIEMRLVPMDEEHMSINVDKVLDYVDDYTIGVVGILGITYTGKYDDIKALDKKLEEYNKTAKLTVPMHIDAASGGMFAPFIEPELEWDFRLKNVVSISTSGHKYGLVYPGIGWVLWRDKEYLPQELVFDVSYLGGKIPTMAINFSRSASQIIGQYYNFLRYGFEGYRQIHQRTKDVAMFLASELEKTGLFQIYNNGENLPIVCYKLRDDINVDWTLYDLADRLLMKGWQVPAYPLPADLQDTIIQRIVCRADLSHNLAELYLRDLKAAIEDLNNARVLNQKSKTGVQGFTH